MTTQLSAINHREIATSVVNGSVVAAPVAGALMYIKNANTTDVATVYTDAALSVAHANPIVADSGGLFPQVFFATGTYDIFTRKPDAATEALQTLISETEDFAVVNTFSFSGGIESISGAVRSTRNVNVQTGTSYTIQDSDRAKLVTFTNAAAIAVTLPTPSGSFFATGWHCRLQNRGDGVVTVTASANLDGAATLTLRKGEGAAISSEGSAFYTERGGAGSQATVLEAGSELTISSGVISVSRAAGMHTVDNESDASSDDLNTINNGYDGQLVVLRTANDARAVTVKHNTGNIYNPAGIDVVLAKTQDAATLRYDAALAKWIVLAASLANQAYVSSAITLTTGYQSYGPFSHGLPGRPKSVLVTLRCLSADAGYSAGDEIIVTPFWYQTAGPPNERYGLQAYFTATQIGLIQAVNGITAANKSNGTEVNLDLTTPKWSAYINANF